MKTLIFIAIAGLGLAAITDAAYKFAGVPPTEMLLVFILFSVMGLCGTAAAILKEIKKLT